MELDLGDHIGQGIRYLRSVQQPDGSFLSFSSPTKRPFRGGRRYHTTFTPALILHALSQLPAASDVCRPLAAWLLEQKNGQWAFNYWSKEAPERRNMPYPDDLDDTFCALIALQRHNPSLIDARALGNIVQLLVATESAVGGPYRTWLVPPTAAPVWRDVDLAVNANIARFLQMVAHPLPKLTKLMEDAIASDTFSSPYYPSPYPLLYYVARAYRGSQTARLAGLVRSRQRNGHWGTPLHTALALSALDELGEAAGCERALRYLLSRQQSDGSWPAEAYCLDPAQAGKQHYSGDPALTTAFALEALQRFTSQPPAAPAPDTAASTGSAHGLYQSIIRQAHQEAAALRPPMCEQAQAMLAYMERGDHNREVALLPHFFAQSLASSTVPQPMLRELGLANLYGWTAYLIFDDFLDDSGDIRRLPVAAWALRSSLDHFATAVPRSPAFQHHVRSVFNRIDAANAWEVTNCRFIIHGQAVSVGQVPQYGNLQPLAERSLGHALTPLGVLAGLGITPADLRAKRLQRALEHYLIARQLGDDLRDWEPDIRAGHCSYVVAAILAGLACTPGTYSFDELLPRMRQEFTAHTLTAVSKLIIHHTSLAQHSLVRSALVTDASPVAQLIDDLEALAKQQLAAQADAAAFLEAYQKPIAK